MQMKFIKKAAVVAMTVMVFGSALTVHAEDAVYTVKRGDSLSKIAKEVYGSSKEWKAIYEANKGIVKDANTLYAGQQLVLPGKPSETTTETSTETTTEQNEVTQQQPAENVAGILNMAVREFNQEREEEEYSIMPAEVTFSRPTPFWEELLYGKPALPAPDGYEWKEVDICFDPYTTEMQGDLYSYLSEVYIEGMDQTWSYLKTANFLQMDPSMVANWTAERYDPNVNYDQFTFWFDYNGVRYTDCKLLCAKEWAAGTSGYGYEELIIMLLPKDYKGSVVYTAYGAKIVDGEPVENKEEAVRIPIQ